MRYVVPVSWRGDDVAAFLRGIGRHDYLIEHDNHSLSVSTEDALSDEVKSRIRGNISVGVAVSFHALVVQ